jgi:putative membrane protein
MKLLKNLITVLVLLATIAVGVLFALQNKEPIGLDLLVYAFEPRSLALWLLLALGLGGLLGLTVSGVLIVRLRTSLSIAQRKLSKTAIELDKLRSSE